MKIERDERKFDFHGIGLAIKKAREREGMTQEQLGYIVDRDPRTIMYHENDGQHPSLAQINALCVLIQDFYTVARGDVFHITAGSFFAEKATFLNQLCHPLQRLFLLQYVHKRDFSVCTPDLIHTECMHFHITRRINIRIRSENVIVDILLDR